MIAAGYRLLRFRNRVFCFSSKCGRIQGGEAELVNRVFLSMMRSQSGVNTQYLRSWRGPFEHWKRHVRRRRGVTGHSGRQSRDADGSDGSLGHVVQAYQQQSVSIIHESK
jgi:hypothetical protein